MKDNMARWPLLISLTFNSAKARMGTIGPTALHDFSLTVRLKTLRGRLTEPQDVITKVTSHLTLQVVRGSVTRDELLPLRSITAGQVGSHPILGARIVEHGYVGRRAVVEGDDVLASRVSNVCSLLLNRPVASGEGLHAVAQEREHGNTAVLDLLDLQLS